MPGILPMKVIKVGNNSQSRIAQACDRCRSKKIRCDGVRPCCSQCANVGFECKTSDKLSRRAFPRGYTESLEERVRSLEAEVRELKDLLDEKDEKIDMLSKMHSNRRVSIENNSIKSSPPVWDSRTIAEANDANVLRPQQVLFSRTESPDASGPASEGRSSGSAFADMLQHKLETSAKSCIDITLTTLFEQTKTAETPVVCGASSTAPPRMFSDRAVNIFFQEWAPLFPVLHRPTFLKQYEEYVTKPENISDKHKLAQLHLVFSIAGISSPKPDEEHVALCDQQWQKAIEAVSADNTLVALQTLVLAIICCISKADYKKLLYHMSNAVALCYRLGLHKNQDHEAFISLNVETKKKVFWTLYTLDCFTAAMLGVPKLLKEADIRCERPKDVDDECLTEKGLKQISSTDDSKISNALALFDLSRILAKVLEDVYPAAVMHRSSTQKLSDLEKQLSDWYNCLGPQHKLTFAQDKPSTNLTGSRSAFLSLAYYYTRNLIHRPLLSSPSEHNESSAIISIGEASKRTIQIIQLLEERNMSFSFCLNKVDLLTLCGLSLVYQSLDLRAGSSMSKDGNRLIAVIQTVLRKTDEARATTFEKLVNVSIPVDTSIKSSSSPDGSLLARTAVKLTSKPDYRWNDSAPLAVPTVENLEALRAYQERLRRTKSSQSPSIDSMHKNNSSVSPTTRPSLIADLVHRAASSSHIPTLSRMRQNSFTVPLGKNLDYLSLSNTPSCSRPASPVLTRTSQLQHMPIFSGASTHPTPSQAQKASTVPAADWQTLLAFIDNDTPNMYDTPCGGKTTSISPRTSKRAHHLDSASSVSPELYSTEIASPSDAYGNVWGPSIEHWNYDGLSLHEFTKQELSMNLSHSTLSFSEESLSSGDEQNGEFYGSSGSDTGVSESPPSLFKSEFGPDLLIGDSGKASFSFEAGENFGL